tara:strand:+ start:8 stop:844 length:837 start_codon:yes stop_codon:yes gene_type:complete
MVTGERAYPSLFGVTAHEMAHTWFQHILANNEAKHPWMDEGFTEYITSLAEEAVQNSASEFPHKSSYDRYYALSRFQAQNSELDLEQPQTVHSDRWNWNFAYGASSYSKGSVFLSQLGYIIGRKSLAKTIKRYYDEFQFKHPTPNDFKRVAEKVSDLELEWYLNDWTRTTNKIDYDISLYDPAARSITIERKASIPMPLEIEVSFVDGSNALYYIPIDLMQGIKPFDNDVVVLNPWAWVAPEYSFLVEGNKKIVKIEIDPSKRLADVDQKRNILEFTE